MTTTPVHVLGALLAKDTTAPVAVAALVVSRGDVVAYGDGWAVPRPTLLADLCAAGEATAFQLPPLDGPQPHMRLLFLGQTLGTVRICMFENMLTSMGLKIAEVTPSPFPGRAFLVQDGRRLTDWRRLTGTVLRNEAGVLTWYKAPEEEACMVAEAAWILDGTPKTAATYIRMLRLLGKPERAEGFMGMLRNVFDETSMAEINDIIRQQDEGEQACG